MRGFGTVYKQPGSRFWWIQYWANGERRRESTGTERFQEASKALKAKLAEIENGELPAAGALLVKHLYDALERDYTINRRKDLDNVKSRWENHLEPALGRMGVRTIDADQVNIYIATRQNQGAQNATVNRELAILKRMFKLALKAGKIKTVPYIPMLQERNVRKGFVKDAQYDALARETAKIGLWMRAMFEVAYTYGWRKGELLAMRVRQADLMERTVTLDPGETKNDEGRAVEMTAKVFDLLTQCAAGKQPDDYLFTREKDIRGRKVRTGGRIDGFRREWRDATRAAGCEGLLFHDLRRSGVRNMRRQGISEKVAMTISGHKTRSVFERYNIVDRSDLHEAVQRMEKGARERQQRELFQQEQIQFQPDPPPETPKKPAGSDRQRTAIESAQTRVN